MNFRDTMRLGLWVGAAAAGLFAMVAAFTPERTESNTVQVGKLVALVQQREDGFYFVIPRQGDITSEITNGPFETRAEATSKAVKAMAQIGSPFDLPSGALADRSEYRGRTLQVIRDGTEAGAFELDIVQLPGDPFGQARYTGFSSIPDAVTWGRALIDREAPEND